MFESEGYEDTRKEEEGVQPTKQPPLKHEKTKVWTGDSLEEDGYGTPPPERCKSV